MEYEYFCDQLEEEVRRIAPNGLEITRQTLEKNNGVHTEVLQIREKRASFAPMIHLERFYRGFENGISFRRLAERVMEEYEKCRIAPPPENFFSDYEKIRDRIYCRLVNRNLNREMLREIPYEKWADLAVVYYYEVDARYVEDATILIRKEHLEGWEISPGELEECAWTNTIRDQKPFFRTLSSVLKEMDPDLASGQEEDTLWLLSNSRKYFGAIAVCYPGMLDRIGKTVGGDFFILPSSIHECLILPAEEGYRQKELSSLVRDVNRTQVEPQEILSDHAYYYHCKVHRLTADGFDNSYVV